MRLGYQSIETDFVDSRAGLNGQDPVMRMIYTQQVPVDLFFFL